jgi:Na+-transporting methylmalonyl-CoA/oxaloacetate decarboxylase gamma subunit
MGSSSSKTPQVGTAEEAAVTAIDVTQTVELHGFEFHLPTVALGVGIVVAILVAICCYKRCMKQLEQRLAPQLPLQAVHYRHPSFMRRHPPGQSSEAQARKQQRRESEEEE